MSFRLLLESRLFQQLVRVEPFIVVYVPFPPFGRRTCFCRRVEGEIPDVFFFTEQYACGGLGDLGIVLDGRLVDCYSLPFPSLADLFTLGICGFFGCFDLALRIDETERGGIGVVGEFVRLLRRWRAGGRTGFRVVFRLSCVVCCQCLLYRPRSRGRARSVSSPLESGAGLVSLPARSSSSYALRLPSPVQTSPRSCRCSGGIGPCSPDAADHSRDVIGTMQPSRAKISESYDSEMAGAGLTGASSRIKILQYLHQYCFFDTQNLLIRFPHARQRELLMISCEAMLTQS